MQAVREIRRVKDHKLQIDLPPSFDDQDVEVIVLPSTPKRRESFCPADFYNFTDVPSTQIRKDSEEMRNEWERKL